MKFLVIGAFFAIFSDVHGIRPSLQKTPLGITGNWYKPSLNSSVFYLHFRDRISWIEADAVCQFHHSELIMVNYPSQFDDVKSYLRKLSYEEPIWINFRVDPGQPLFNQTNDNESSVEKFWNEKPSRDEILCVTSSPSDNYKLIGRRCNGPDVASFICEMPVPEWVRTSGCVSSSDASVILTFHPEKSMVRVGKICPDTGAQVYRECHKTVQNTLNQTELYSGIQEELICRSANETPSNPSTERISGISSSSSDSSKLSTSERTWNSMNAIEFNTTSDLEFYNRSMSSMETFSETSTITLPQEMSFAEEPIKTSKPFVTKETNEQPDQSTVSEEIVSQVKFNSKTINSIPSVPPMKSKKTSEIKEDVFKTYYSSQNSSTNSSNTSAEPESHEAFNHEKNPETFQSLPSTEKSILTTISEKMISLTPSKDIGAKSNESEKELISDQTYNIEGTFEANDFVNAEPINVYKKIDLTPLENRVTTETIVPQEKNSKSESSGISPPTVTATESASTAISTNLSTSITKIPSMGYDRINTEAMPTPPSNASQSQTKTTQKTLTQTDFAAKAKSEPVPNDNKVEIRRQKVSSLLSGKDPIIEDINIPNRKRQILNVERHSFYPYFLGRILG